MKKLFSVLLSASVLTLAACGKQEAPATEAATEAPATEASAPEASAPEAPAAE